MHTIELLQEALGLAEQLGYRVRQEWLGGSGGGGCELKGRKWIFLDLASGPPEHLDAVIQVLRRQPRVAGLPMSPQLHRLVQVRRVA